MNNYNALETDKFYNENREIWELCGAAYSGYRALIRLGCLTDFHNYTQYLQPGRAYGFSYTRRIAQLLNGFVSQSRFSEDFQEIEKNQLWQNFLSDVDFMGTDWPVFWNSIREIAMVYGFVGILISQSVSGKPSELLKYNVYPYLSFFSPLSILERKVSRDLTGRPQLSFLKLRMDDPETILTYTPEMFQVFDISKGKPELIEDGENVFGQIPFVFFCPIKDPTKFYNGISLVGDIAPIDASMIRSAIRVDQLEHKAAFPMLVKPYDIDQTKEREVRVGVSEILEFDPETPSAKPYWLAPEADKAIEPILKIWEKKKNEVFEMSFLNSFLMAGQSKTAKSGETYKQQFRFLEAQLSRIVDSEIEARKGVVSWWLRWQAQYAQFSVSHSKQFEIEDLISTIDDILTERMVLAGSPTAQKELQKQVVENGSLKVVGPAKKTKIYEEIDKQTPADIAG